jgi:hypothetical protein
MPTKNQTHFNGEWMDQSLARFAEPRKRNTVQKTAKVEIGYRLMNHYDKHYKEHNEGFTEYMSCPVCGYVKYCKVTPRGYICRSCARIEKEKQDERK